GCAGLLIWVATQVGVQTVGRFWAAMGIVAGAGFVMALAQVVGSWTSGLRLRLSPGTFLLAFLPVLICVGWVMFATQPGHGLWEGRIHHWSSTLGLLGIVHALGLWHGALAFGFGLVLGLSLDAVPEVVLDAVPAHDRPAYAATPPAADEPVVAERREVVEEDTQAPVH
ncbi:MAG: hypothetical protein JOZ56_10485, partial [Actinobacteria bacterium]|nr:hypothetical protein [Actinomycetota bacterium]